MAFNRSSQQAHMKFNVYKLLGWKLVIGFLIVALLPPAIMFVAAGRTDWWEAWVMVGVLALTAIVSRVILIVRHPDLAVERARWMEGKDY